LPPGQPAPAQAARATIENHAASPKSWALQLGSFASHANAEQLVRAVRAHSAPAYVSTSGAGKSLRYRVRVGPLADRAAAERMLAKLKSEGQAASVVAP
jgi:cell division septation protein DedD